MPSDSDTIIAKATAALETSVQSIVDDDAADEATKRDALMQTFAEYEEYVERNVGKQRDGGGSVLDHPVAQLAQLLVAGGSYPDISSALHFLLCHPAGVALVQTHKGDPGMDRTAELRDIVKTHGAVALAKVLVEDGSSHGISEHELTDAITAYAKAAHPGISPDSAFAKVFTALTDEGRTLRQAVALAKAAPFDPEPQVISGERARGGDVDVNDPRAAMEAYNTLMALAADYRRANPAVSEAQAKLGSDYSARATPKKQIICAPDAH